MRGGPRGENLQNFLWSRKKPLVTDLAAIFFVFQVNISCKTTSIILYFKYASLSVVTRKKGQNTNPHPDGNFFDDRFGLGILRDAWRRNEWAEFLLILPRETRETFGDQFILLHKTLSCNSWSRTNTWGIGHISERYLFTYIARFKCRYQNNWVSSD